MPVPPFRPSGVGLNVSSMTRCHHLNLPPSPRGYAEPFAFFSGQFLLFRALRALRG